MKAAFCTLGCKVNQYDTQAMRELFERAGYECVDFDEPADVYVVNTCTVTATGDKKSRQMISRAHSKNPDAKIVVAGCYSQRSPDEVYAIDGVSLVIGTKDRDRVVELVSALDGEKKMNAVSTVMTQRDFEDISATHEGKTRAHLKIQDGCDRFCTYCIIPYVRGPVRSRKPDGIRTELIKLADAGFKEAVLTGIHLMSYGKDLKSGEDLSSAIALASSVPGIERIRLGSLEPQLLRSDFVRSLAENKKVCRQFHLSLQSGSDTVLARMNRRYTADEYLECVNVLRNAMPDCAVTTDVIVGFPGETEEEFIESVEFVKRASLSRLHVFPYSRRTGTKAADMKDQIRNSVKSERAKLMISVGAQLESAFIEKNIGSTQSVLFEEREGEFIVGYTGSYIRAVLRSEDDRLIHTVQNVRLTSAQKDRAECEIFKNWRKDG